MDDLEENPLYKAFLTKYRREFEIACTFSYIIAIPHSDSLDNIIIDQVFASSHILIPSKLLKLHYTPLQAGLSDDIEIDGNQLIVHISKKKTIRKVVNILAEEIGYNARNKEFRTLLIDKPLLEPQNKSFMVSLFSPLSPKNSTPRRNKAKKPTKPLQNHDDCLKYLESLSQEITMDLESEVKLLQSHYLILSEYLNDAAERISNLVDTFIPKYIEASIGSNNLVCDSIRQIIRVAVENYIVHLMHGKLIVSVFNKHEMDDRKLSERINEIDRAKLTICQLGAQSIFSDFVLTDEIHQELRRLVTLQSPLAMVSSLMKLVELISGGLNQSVKFKYLSGYEDSSGETVHICSDDLIASFVYALAQAKPSNLFSISKYLETFGWTSVARDQAAYYTATFQIVIQYVYNYANDAEPVSMDGPDVCSPISKNSLDIVHLKLDSEEQLGSNETNIPYKPLARNQFIDSLDSRGSSESTGFDSTFTTPLARSRDSDWELLRV